MLLPKRIVGLPADRLRLSDNQLYVNDSPLTLSNKAGQIEYVVVPGCRYLAFSTNTFTVPEGHYFVLGDNSRNSVDSRYWGALPADCIRGRVQLCFWPMRDIGIVR